MDNTSILLFFPALFFLFSIVGRNTSQAPSINMRWSVMYMLIISLIYGLGDIVNDKIAYSELFDIGFDDIEKDIGWSIYQTIIKNILGNNVYFFFIITAFLYCFSYIYVGKKIFGKNKVFTFVVIATGLLGFSSYGCNSLRQGLALSFVLYALPQQKHKIQYLLFFASISLHISLLLLIGCYFLTLKISITKIYAYIWIGCFIVSALGFNLVSYASNLAGLDYRFVEYSMGADSGNVDYNIGFRIDFIIYSLLPAIYALYIKTKCKISDNFYEMVLNLYIIVNSIWLLIIRIPYTDRFAYLSWFLIPILLYYPYSKGMIYKNKLWLFKTTTMVMFMIVIILSFR